MDVSHPFLNSGAAMLDVVFIGASVLFFAVCIGYVAACERLMK